MKSIYSTKIIDSSLYETIKISGISGVTGITNGQGYIYAPFIFIREVIWCDRIEILRTERKTKLDRLNGIMNDTNKNNK